MRKFGLIGYPLAHSFSGKYFREKFQRESIIDCTYSNYEIPSISALSDILKDQELNGLNVTIPYKESVIPFLHKKDPVVEEIAACNCIKILKQELTGYNTDVIGFEISLKEKLTVMDMRALILGTGGSSKAVAWVLKRTGIEYLFVSRNKSHHYDRTTYEDLNREILETHSLIINCTPLGMEPNTGVCPPLPYQWIGREHYLYDLVYNPAKTLFLEKGKMTGARIKNGADMLAIQAEASWVIWNA
ncbi:MAG TPA: shikimate dehydrogenase [Puia sp.]|jgi:shikimate dehydrogenase|nr:shikimate dehydrogenase [Puia sp.]